MFRTDLERTRQIGILACILGYLMILPGVPIIFGGIHQVLIFAFKGSGVTRTAVGPALQTGEFFIIALNFSFVASWLGILVSIPVVVWARLNGWFGWATAALTGAVEALVLLPLFFGAQFDFELFQLCVGGAVLGLSFWAVVRWMHPEVWRTGTLISD